MDTPDDEFRHRAELLDAWIENQRQIAALQARSAELLAQRLVLHAEDVASDGFHRDVYHRSMVSEYAAAGRIANGTMDNAFADAHFLAEYPRLREAFGQGAVTAAHVREVIGAGHVVAEAVLSGAADAAARTVYEVAALVIAERSTPATTRAELRAVAAALAGDTVAERHARAKSERAVSVRSVGDGLALLQIVLPEYLATAILDRLTRLAGQVIRSRADLDPVLDLDILDSGEGPIRPEDIDPLHDDAAALGASAIFGECDTFTTDPLRDPLTDSGSPDLEHPVLDERGIDEVRADLATDLLLGSDPTATRGSGLDGITGRVQVTISASTIAGQDERPAELDGHGPMLAEDARLLAGRTSLWSRLFLDAEGMLVETDSYVPTEAMKRFLHARDQHCRFPGCRMPVHRCQIDHNHDHAKGGRTRLDNLSAFCAGHHALKHPDIDERHRWTARQLPGGEVQWTSPLGRAYADPPPRRVMFV
ncbi:DUF222 domain-containing protein [Microbacterium sp.]|uniref:HNH endonuclease signature motif containing protein n=1 Tax=Microbacterium sp. TaxID=51671 RepID=UPI0039E5470B